MKRLVFFILSCLKVFVPSLHAQADEICAEVAMEIGQEAALEREAFEARLRIVNNLPKSLRDLEVVIRFSDDEGRPVKATTDPAEADAEVRFFFNPQHGEALPAVDGGDQVDLTWIIIPTVEAGGTTPSGKNYFVGADLSYRIGGSSDVQSVQVAPDQIVVRPQPELALDYFLPRQVLGDDPLTPLEIEPSKPFDLGLRVRNIGFGLARSVSIDSAQPTIVANDNDLIVDFQILGAEVNGVSAKNTLRVDLGDLPPIDSGFAGLAHWRMESSLSGVFTGFEADIAHADELGGDLTALIKPENIRTHSLIGMVVADLPGRDVRRDFLASDVGNRSLITLFESSGPDSPVLSDLNGVLEQDEADQWSFSAPETSGFSYVRLMDPTDGALPLTGITRTDGKNIREENFWQDQTWDKDANVWNHWIHLFDSDNADSAVYWVNYGPLAVPNEPPALDSMADRTVKRETNLRFTVRATDPESDFIELSASGLPGGSEFSETVRIAGESRSRFQWTPREDQIGTYPIRFTAEDSAGNSVRAIVHVAVVDNARTGFEAFMRRYFSEETDPALLADDADPDFDGMPNLAEYGQQTNPAQPDRERGPQVSVETFDGEAYACIEFRRRTDDPDLEFRVFGFGADPAMRTEESTLVPGYPRQDGVPVGLERVKIRDSVPLSADQPRRFLELNVTFVPSN